MEKQLKRRPVMTKLFYGKDRYQYLTYIFVIAAIFIMIHSGCRKTLSPEAPYPLPTATPSLAGMLVFSAMGSSSKEIYTYDFHGNSINRLTNDAYTDNSPCWSSDGTKIFFISNREGANDVYSMDEGGAGITRITNSGLNDSPVRGETQGELLINKSFPENGIYLLDLVSKVETPVYLPSSANVWLGDYNKYNGKVLFYSAEAGLNHIYSVNLDGSAKAQLTEGPYSDDKPVAVPGTGSFIFTASRSGSQYIDVNIADTDGSNIRRVNVLSLQDHFSACVSPDGYWIASAMHTSLTVMTLVGGVEIEILAGYQPGRIDWKY